MGYDSYAYVLEFETVEAQEEWDWHSWDLNVQYPGVHDITNQFVSERFDRRHQIWRSWRDESGFPSPVRTNPDAVWEDIAISMLHHFYMQVLDPGLAKLTAKQLRSFYPNDCNLTEMADWLEYWAIHGAHFYLSC